MWGFVEVGERQLLLIMERVHLSCMCMSDGQLCSKRQKISMVLLMSGEEISLYFLCLV